MENKMETTIVYWGYNGIMENKMEATIVYWGYIGITAAEDWSVCQFTCGGGCLLHGADATG